MRGIGEPQTKNYKEVSMRGTWMLIVSLILLLLLGSTASKAYRNARNKVISTLRELVYPPTPTIPLIGGYHENYSTSRSIVYCPNIHR